MLMVTVSMFEQIQRGWLHGLRGGLLVKPGVTGSAGCSLSRRVCPVPA